MRVSRIVELLDKDVLEVANMNGRDPEISGITHNSRNFTPGGIFICIKGTNFNSHLLAHDLQEKGAKAFLAEEPLDLDEIKVPVIYVKNSRRAEAILLMELRGHPYKKLVTIGVTGTNGKTTITTMLKHILDSFEKKTSLVGTVRNHVAGKTINNPKNTTPGPSTLINYLQESVKEDYEYFVMEVSSHALAMYRVEALRFDIAVLTNVTRDHLDYHCSFEEYYNTKLKLFELLKPNGKAIVNGDRINVCDVRVSKDKLVTYGFGDESHYKIKDLEMLRTGMFFTIETPYGSSHKIYTRLVGQHNAYNVAACVAILDSLNYDVEHVADAISNFTGVPGRFEFVEEATKYGFEVVIDFAHTPDALEKLLLTAGKLTEGRIITVFGAGGNADKGKRPLMGQVASKFSDVIVLTSDDPKREDPNEILTDIEAGVDKFKPYLIIPERREAISVALTLANRQDMVIIAGRGHENYQLIGDNALPFNDKNVVKEILETKFRRNMKK